MRSVAALCWLALATPVAPTAHPPPSRPFAPDLRSFSGVNYLSSPEVMGDMGLGWARESFPVDWNAVEPKQGEWHWEAMDGKVAAAHAMGVEVLPMLGYTAKWAATADGGFGPAKDVADWEDYVEHVVARYSRPPFNLRYYQVWNEPTWQPMDFWKRTGPQWIDLVYLPAAKIIRRYGCQVVLGGWAGVDYGHLFEALDTHEAWRWTDIVDVHYCGIGVWQEIYDRYLKTGKCRGAWQTEIGFHPFPEYIANLYPRAIHWALTHGWTEDPDKYKLFWFASWGAGPDGPKCLTMPGDQAASLPDGNTLTAHGLRLRTLAQVFGDGRLAVFDHFTSAPSFPPTLDEERPTILGFRVGDRLVIALILDADTLKTSPTVRLTLPDLATKPQSLRLVSSTGVSRDLPFDFAGGGRLTSRPYMGGTLTGTVPMGELPCEIARKWGKEWRVAVGYVVVG